MKRRLVLAVWLMFGAIMGVAAQMERAVLLEELQDGVTVQRAQTTNPLPIQLEAVVGAGDVISTHAGRAGIPFITADLLTVLEANTTYQLQTFAGTNQAFTFSARLERGYSTQIVQPLLRASSYQTETPAFTVTTRLARFLLRVEEDGRSAMLVLDGDAQAQKAETSVDVPRGYGVRANLDGTLSDVVEANTFEILDSMLDGCSVRVATRDDVSLNLRNGPAFARDVVGYIPPSDVIRVVGTSGRGWYRLRLADGSHAWFLSSGLRVVGPCARLRPFPDWHQES